MDAQIFWDPLGNNSCWHGVTSVVMGNCGFSLAPCAEKDKLMTMHNLERAEDISPEAMQAGIQWSWETYPDYLDTIDRLPKGINYSGYVGHSALRTHVMGKRGTAEAAGEDDVKAMQKELEASLRAGAMGFSHLGHQHPPHPGRHAGREPLRRVVGDRGAGRHHGQSRHAACSRSPARPAYARTEKRRRPSASRSRSSPPTPGVPITFGNPWYSRRSPDPDAWRDQFAMCDDITAAGGRVLIQGSAGWHGSMRSFETLLPFDKAPVWIEFRQQPLDEQQQPAPRSRTSATR